MAGKHSGALGRCGDTVSERSDCVAIAAEAEPAPPDPDGPNMFRCAAPGHVSALYAAAGLRDVAERDVDVELVTRSPAQYWEKHGAVGSAG